MNTINIVRHSIAIPGELDDFVEMLHSVQFKYNAWHLALAGLSKPDEISGAINRAMKICRLNGINIREHFKPLYISDEKHGGIYCDWRMTKQGFILVVMNAPVTNAAIAHWQWKLINALLPIQ